MRKQLDSRPATKYLEQLDTDNIRLIDGEIQKRLTKAVPFFRGKLTQNLGLRYAPEIRFYKDNSLDQFDSYRE
jgi:ribosome-binding factor A